MDRITLKYAEQQVGRLAQMTGHTMTYMHQPKGTVVAGDPPKPGLADAMPYGTPGSLWIDTSAAGGWLTIRGHDEEGKVCRPFPFYTDSMKGAPAVWEACAFAMAVLREERERNGYAITAPGTDGRAVVVAEVRHV